MGQPLGEGKVACLERVGDAASGVRLLVGELPQKAAVESGVPGEAIEAIGSLDTVDLGETYGRRFAGGRGGRLPRGDPSTEGRKQSIRVNRFGDVIVHSRFETPLPFFHQSVRGHRQDGKVIETGIGAQQPCRRVAVHFGHLQVHQDDIKGRRLGPVLEQLDCDPAVAGNGYGRSLAFEQFLAICWFISLSSTNRTRMPAALCSTDSFCW